jgi:hypothetical protein
MLARFPPGATACQNKNKCWWREFAFALHQVQQAVDPVVSLKKILSGWNEINLALRENSRRRKPRLSNYRFS